MLPPTDLTSADNPRIKAVARLLRQGRQRRKLGLFVAEGLRQIERAIGAGIVIEELFWSPQRLGARAHGVQAWQRQTGAAGYTVTESLLGKISYCENPQGVVAVCATPQRDLAAVVADAELLLVAVGLEKPGNIGAIARSCDAAGGGGVMIADAVVDPFHPNSLTASTGAVLTLPVVGAASQDIRAALVAEGFRLIVTSPDAAGTYYDADLTGKCAIVIGAEDRGLDEAWLKAGRAVAIPMAGQSVDSLNASAAAAAVLFEAVRQRRG